MRNNQKKMMVIKKNISYIGYVLIIIFLVSAVTITFVYSDLIFSKSLPMAYADSNYIHIGIEWSKTCELIIQSGNLTACSTPDFVNKLYQNTQLKPSYQKIIDDVKEDPQKQFQVNNQILKNKIECIKKDYCNIFQIRQNQKMIIWFNPDNDVRDYLDKIITIQSNMLDKNIYNESSPIIDNDGKTRTITFNTHDLFISSCSRAILDPNIIWQDLGKVIYYLYKDCKNPEILGKLKDNYEETISKHILDISTSPNWQSAQKMKEDIERCKVKC